MTEEKKLILVADDEEDIQVILTMYLENIGYEVATAFDGLDAIERIKERKPALVLMDIMMPVIDGIEVTKRLKADEETKDIPIVILTAAAQSSTAEKAMSAGADEYIAKPFEPDNVKAVIDKILNEQ
jgi:two-component system, cell cycle response regulator DivK